MIVSRIENAVNKYLQRKIIITLNNKCLKSGKLLLFSIKDFYLVFTLHIHQTKKHFELPYPFAIKETDTCLYFNYGMDKFCYNNKEIETNAKLLSNKKSSKFFNNIVRLQIEDESINTL